MRLNYQYMIGHLFLYVTKPAGHVEVMIANKTTTDSLEDNDSLFVVYGSTHAVMQEPALKELISNEF